MFYQMENCDSKFDLRMGQMIRKVAVKYRCDFCRKESTNELEVRSIFWNNNNSRAYCSIDCANDDADRYYEKGFSPVYYSGETRFVFENNVKTRYAFGQTYDFTDTDFIEIINWLVEIFNKYNNSGFEWKILTKSNQETLEMLKDNKEFSFNFTNQAKAISISNQIVGLFWNNAIFLKEVLKEELQVTNA